MSILDLFRRKSATAAQNQAILDFLGIDGKTDAISEAVYYTCLKILSESIGKLPLKLLQHTERNGVEPVRNHKYYPVLNERPNRFMSPSTFWGYMEFCRNHYGNAYAIIDTSNPRKPQLWPVNPGAVSVWYDNVCLLKDVPDIYYKINGGGNGSNKISITLSSEEVLHFRSHHSDNGIVGISVRQQLRDTIQGSQKSQEMVNQLYKNGMTAKMVLNYTGGANAENVEILTKGIEEYASGKMKDRGIENIIPLPIGMQLTPLNLKLADSQFLEIRQFTATQIASAFGVKPYQIGDLTKSSYASAEAQQLYFLIDTLLYIVKQYEEEINYKLLSDAESKRGLHAKFNTNVILRADHKTQVETLASAVSNFLYTPNEARSFLDLPRVDGGDKLLGNGSTIPVDLVGIQYDNSGKEE